MVGKRVGPQLFHKGIPELLFMVITSVTTVCYIVRMPMVKIDRMHEPDGVGPRKIPLLRVLPSKRVCVSQHPGFFCVKSSADSGNCV